MAARGLHLILCTALAVAVALAVVGSVLAGDPGVASAAGDVRTTANVDALRFRVAYGFRTDSAYLAQVAADPVSSWDYGIALAPDEMASMARRMDTQLKVGEFVTQLETNPNYAGLVIDQKRDGVLVIYWVGSDQLPQRALATLPSTAAYEVRSVGRSEAELRSLQAKVDHDTPDLRSAGIYVVLTAVDTLTNRLRIGVVGLTTASKLSLEATYGSAVEVEEGSTLTPGTCTGRTNCGSPIKGGLSIHGGGATCTSGFLGKALGGSQRYVITAGHCLDASGLNAYWYHNTTLLGDSSWEDYFNGTQADVGVINYSEPLSKNLVFGSGITNIRSMTSIYTEAQQTLGATICRSGQTSGYTCGQVTVRNLTGTDPNGYTIYDLYAADFPSSSGDSGAPMIYGNSAGGVVHGTWTAYNYTTYATLDRIASYAGVTACTSSSC